jgi:hypothetical protein
VSGNTGTPQGQGQQQHTFNSLLKGGYTFSEDGGKVYLCNGQRQAISPGFDGREQALDWANQNPQMLSQGLTGGAEIADATGAKTPSRSTPRS